jgi:hypothetical protein
MTERASSEETTVLQKRLAAQVNYRAWILVAVATVYLGGCGVESEQSVIRELNDRMISGAGEHRGRIVVAKNVEVLPALGSSDQPMHLYELALDGQSCILIATTLEREIITINSSQPWPDFVGKTVAYTYLPDALMKWPFAAFDLNRDCLPAQSRDIEVIAEMPMPHPI